MSDYKPIPINEAWRIAQDYRKSHVVIVCYDADHHKTHLTTYGRTAEQKVQAAKLGEILLAATGANMAKLPGDDEEDFRLQFDAAMYAEAKDLLKQVLTRAEMKTIMKSDVKDFLERAKAL